ncbi:MAG TPA: glycosyl hydrolase [Solirubrobacterales bacterium]|nr:glycosyl hydrolase [Solirubrobacterales bacterium]
MPAKFWGVVSQHQPNAEEFARLKRGGVDSIRVAVPWDGVEPVEGEPNWGGVDAYIGGAAAAGIEALPFLYGAPTWAVPAMTVDARHGVKAPAHLPVRTTAEKAAWATFLAQAVGRYGPTGTFWSENPSIPRHPVRTWQIWNEENFKYFVARPNPAEYGKLVKNSYATIKSLDHGAKIVLGGMFAHPIEALPKTKRPRVAYFAGEFLEQMYQKTPGVKQKFNGVALHPYTGEYQTLTPYIEELRGVLKKNHDSGKGIWLTELGWSSGHPEPGNSFAKGLQGQAKQLKGAFKLLMRNQAKWRIQKVYWFSVDDQVGACNFCDGSGLFGEGFIPKPSWKAYVHFAGGRP